TSDQGFFLGNHGLFDKRFMYEDSLRIPLIVRWPAAIPSGATAEAMALNLDFAPTFLEAAGLPVPSDMQGRSLLPILRGQRPAGSSRTASTGRWPGCGGGEPGPRCLPAVGPMKIPGSPAA